MQNLPTGRAFIGSRSGEAFVQEGEDHFVLAGKRLSADFAVECNWVTRRLAIGGMIGTPTNMRKLRDHGISHVLDLQAEFDDRPLARDLDVKVMWLGIPEPAGNLPIEIIADGVRFAKAALREDAGKLFVHCLAGRNRSPTFAYAILRAFNWDHDEAIRAILAAEPAALLDQRQLRGIARLLGGSPDSI